jgi:signal transduction histidine kinase
LAEPKESVLVSLQGAFGADARRWLADAGFGVVEGDAPAGVVVAALDAALAAPPAAPRGAPPELIVVAPPLRLAQAVALLRRGACDVLVEPLDRASLLDAVARAAARARAPAAPALLVELARTAPPLRVSAGVAHEIANPVAVLVSALAALEGDLAAIDEGSGHLAVDGIAAAWWARAGRAALVDAREAAGEASAAAERLKQLAHDLRSLQRAEPAPGGDAPTDVGLAAATAVRLARPLLAPVARLAADTPLGVSAAASPGAIVRVVLELLLCAMDALARSRRRGALVRVACRAEPGFAVVEVEDDAPRDGPVPGGEGLAGVGRAVALELTALLGGTLTSSPTPAGGTLVALRLRR